MTATVFREGHDKLGAEGVLDGPDGRRGAPGPEAEDAERAGPHEGGGRTVPQLPPDAPLGDVHSGPGTHHGQFSGELELALQGNRPAPAPRNGQGSAGAFDQAGSTTEWSL